MCYKTIPEAEELSLDGIKTFNSFEDLLSNLYEKKCFIYTDN